MKNPQIGPARRDQLTAFCEELLLEHGGAYTLFGTKPVTIEDLYECSEEMIQQMNQYLREHPEIESIMIDRRLDEGWKEWKKMNPRISLQKYILKEIDLGQSKVIVFVNVCNAIDVLEKYYMDFKQVINRDFSPFSLMEELRQGQLECWRKILSNRKTLGILAGYGYRNADLFAKQFPDYQCAAHPSEDNDPRLPAECRLNNRPFRIPIFVMMDKDESEFLVRKYKKEREVIKKLYEGKDFLQVTLDQLNH